MPFDGLALSVICQELDSLVNSRVMKIYQTDKHTILLHLRLPGKNCRLLISADPVFPRIYTTDDEPGNPSTPPAFCMLLRKHIEPGRVVRIRQIGLERLLVLDFECFDPEIGRTEKQLIFELMGRHSNIILVDNEQIILDAIVRKHDDSKSRLLIPGQKYTEPDAQGKISPFSISAPDFIADLRLSSPDLPIAKWVLNSFQGFSKLAAEEVIKRALLPPAITRQETQDGEWQKIWESFSSLLQEVAQGGTPVVVQKPKPDFAVYSLTNRDTTQFANLNSLLDQFFTVGVRQQRLGQLSSKLLKAISNHIDRIKKKEDIHHSLMQASENAEQLKRSGELVTANMHQIKKGDRFALVVDYYDPHQAEISIELNPSLTPSENAQRYFKRYSKIKKGKEFAKEQLQIASEERNYLEEVITHIELADEVETLVEIEKELVRLGYIKTRKRAHKSKESPGRGPDEYVSSDGIILLVGRNNRQNDELTFKIAGANDLWLHAQRIPGSHVIVRHNGPVPDKTLEEAAILAARHSKARTSPKVPVDFTTRRHVKKPSGAKPGFVIYDNFKTVTVDPGQLGNLPKKRRP